MTTKQPVKPGQLDKRLARWAGRLREHLLAERAECALRPPEVNTVVWRRLSMLMRRLQHLYDDDDVSQIVTTISQIQSQLSTAQTCLQTCSSELRKFSLDYQTGMASTAEIYRDLLALQDEYGELCFRGGELSLITPEDIILCDDAYDHEEYNFGRFKMVMAPSNLGELHGLVVAIAQQPFRHGELTHPHVSADRVCMGDGAVAARRAVLGGRIYDYFSIVHAVLRTYDEGSAYRTLNNWGNAYECYDCSVEVELDENCAVCHRSVCGDCARSCESCGCGLCESCCVSCEYCGELLCSECTQICSGCGHRYCHCQSLDKFPELCEVCGEQKLAEEASEQEMTTNAASASADDDKSEEDNEPEESSPMSRSWLDELVNEVSTLAAAEPAEASATT